MALDIGGAAGGAIGLQEVLRQQFERAIAQQKMKEEIRQANMQNAVQTRQLGQGDQRLGLDQQKFGEDQRQFDAQAPLRLATVAHVGAETNSLNRAPEEAQKGRDFTAGQADKAQTFTTGRDAAQHGYQMGEIGAQGRNALAVANVRHPEPTGPTAQQQNEVNDTLALIDQIGNDPALNSAVGPVDQYIGQVHDLNGVNRFNALHNELAGKLQLAQAGKLKGQGQISDKERAMLAAAATALNRGLSEQDYKAELAKVRGQFERMQTGGGMSTAGAGNIGAVQEYDYVPGKGLVPRKQK